MPQAFRRPPATISGSATPVVDGLTVQKPGGQSLCGAIGDLLEGGFPVLGRWVKRGPTEPHYFLPFEQIAIPTVRLHRSGL